MAVFGSCTVPGKYLRPGFWICISYDRLFSMIIFASNLTTKTMIKLKIILTTLFATASYFALSQTPTLSSLEELTSFMRTDLNYNEEQRARNAIIAGSPYLEEEFTEGLLIFSDTYYRDLRLRYNIYEGHFEFESDGQVLYFDPRYTEVDTVWMGENKYIFQEYQDVRSLKRSYMQLLYENEGTQVLSLRETILLQPESAKGYEDAKPARFQPRPDRLFVRFQGEPAREFSGKKSIPELFPEHANELDTYSKKERLRFRQPEELIELCKYYDHLSQ